jgi:hypothetical protein
MASKKIVDMGAFCTFDYFTPNSTVTNGDIQNVTVKGQISKIWFWSQFLNAFPVTFCVFFLSIDAEWRVEK